MLPSTYTCEPFFRYSPATSAWRPKKEMRCHSVASFISPLCLSFHLSVVATRMLVTASPLGIYRVSGSAPRLPTMMTLFTDAISNLPSNQFTYSMLVPLPRHDFQARDTFRGHHFRLAHAVHPRQRLAQPIEVHAGCDRKRQT